MADQRGVKLDANEYASRTVTKQSGVSWPFPVDRRLDQLVEVANAAGANVNRSELVAAIVAAAPDDPEQLLRMALDWRRCQVRDVVIGIGDAAKVVEIPRFRPGRRRADAG
ncbi:hypothetical protein [Mycobacterium marinum]|uniref:hypothetical protein n=1 Tax=Mycobacterium marinum TaxID=1781 RepID=UPI00192201EB|nr:hypothetical protein [Mycobacterium marinum]QQW33523.1 hypothetical protein HXW97_06570 [Mycobacterium marinum]